MRRHPLDEDAPGAEDVLLVAAHAALERQEVDEAGLDPATLLRIGDVPLERGAELRRRGRRVLLLRDATSHLHHVDERPVRDAFAVGQAAATVPQDLLGEPVDVLLEFPRQARLADARDPGDRDHGRLGLLGRGVEQLLDHPELTVATDEGGFERVRAHRAERAGDHAERAMEVDRLRFALQLVLAVVLVDDRGLGGVHRRVTHEHLPGLGDRLDPRGGVDQVAHHHPLALGPEGDRGLAGEHAGSRSQVRSVDLNAHLGDSLGEVERGAHGTFGVVLGRDRRAPHGHHRVADELLDRAAVPADQRPGGLEVVGEKLSDLLGVARLRQRREADEVGEQDGHETAFGRRLLALGSGDRHGGGCEAREEGSAAVTAETLPRLERRAAVRTGGGQGRATVTAESLACLVFTAARCADHVLGNHRGAEATNRVVLAGTRSAIDLVFGRRRFGRPRLVLGEQTVHGRSLRDGRDGATDYPEQDRPERRAPTSEPVVPRGIPRKHRRPRRQPS